MKTLRLRIAAAMAGLLALQALLLPASAAAPLQAPPDSVPAHAVDAADVEAFMDGVMTDQLRTAHIAGAVVAVVAGGHVVLLKGYGYSDIAAHRPVDAHTTLFRPGSVSKLFTFTAVMQLVERGKLDLDADVNTYLKAFKIPDTYPEPITLRHLITHTAGFENRNVELFAPDAAHLLPLADALQRNMPRRVRPPGVYSSYSNYGVALAGLIVEEVSGQSFDEYVEEHIFRPLDMVHSTFREPLPPALAPQMSTGYVFAGGAFIPLDFEYLHNAAPAGSATMTAEDMAHFMIAHLHGGQYESARILEENTAYRMHQQLFSNDSRVPGLAYGFNEGSINGQRSLAHRGDTQWFHSDLHLLIDRDVGLFVSYNSPPPGNQREALIQAFMDRYFPAQAPAAIVPPVDFAERASRYVGEYQNMNRPYATFEKFDEFFGGSRRRITLTPQNTLFLDAGYASMQFVETAPDRFRQVGGQEEMVFRQDGSRTVFFLSSWPSTTVERLSHWTNPQLQEWSLACAMAVFVAFLVSLYRTRDAAKAYPRQQRWMRGSVGAASILYIVFCSTYIPYYLSQHDAISLYGPSMTMRLLLLIPVAAAIVTAAGAALLVVSWVQGRLTVKLKVQYSAGIAAAAFMIWFTQYYNLFGLRG
jgi:CubicO group peptidase (beta-lactamase class C family)